MSSKPRFFPAGDRAILVQLGTEISEEINDRVMALNRTILASRDPAIVETVPAYATVLVHYRPEARSYSEMKAFLSDLAEKVPERVSADENGSGAVRRTLVVPVCYGLHFGPDLWTMQDALGLSREEIIRIHSGRDYRIYMMGFLPGFVYLGGMDERIAYPRLKKPRLQIDAGAVGIAGGQTGIYPSASPGGWRIIGRTPMRLFDPSRDPATPVGAGDFIRFRPVSVDEWYEIRRQVLKGEYEPEVLGQDASSVRGDSVKSTLQHAESRDFLKVLNPGVLTTVQDAGRFGHQHAGMPQAGSMDGMSLTLANLLAGNDESAAVLEFTVFGGSYEVECEGTIAITGADMNPKLNGGAIPMNEAVPVKAGDRLDLGPVIKGMRSYLAVSGGLDVPPVLGSRSTDLKSGLGGLEGRKLKAGDLLRAGLETAGNAGGINRNENADGRDFPQQQPLPAPALMRLAEASDDGITRIRFVFGPQDEMFSEEAKRIFTESVYTVSPASDRMGYRLEGAKIPAEEVPGILSEGISFGSIQVPADGQPIVMMADHQTAGGYAKIGTVIGSDLSLLAQLGPGKRMRFCPVSLDDSGEKQ